MVYLLESIFTNKTWYHSIEIITDKTELSDFFLITEMEK